MLPAVVHRKTRRGSFLSKPNFLLAVCSLLFLVAIANLTWKRPHGLGDVRSDYALDHQMSLRRLFDASAQAHMPAEVERPLSSLRSSIQIPPPDQIYPYLLMRTWRLTSSTDSPRSAVFGQPALFQPCISDPADRHPTHHMCKLHNTVVYEKEIYYIADGPVQLPRIEASWMEMYDAMKYLRITISRPEDLPFDVNTIEVERVKQGVYWFFGSADNYSHGISEYAPTIHGLICRLLKACTFDRTSKLRIFRVPQDQLPSDAGAFPPAFQEAMKCFSEKPVHKLGDPEHKGKAILVGTAAAGIGSDCRAFHWCVPKYGRQPMPHELMRSYQQRLADCTGWDIDAVAPLQPLRITIVDRKLTSRRHILNIDEIRANFEQRFSYAEVMVTYAEGTDLRTQMDVSSQSSVFVIMHGAALANFIFLPQGSAGVHIVGDPGYPGLQDWAQHLVRDLPQNVQLVEYNNPDATKVHPVGDMIRKDPRFKDFTEEQQRMIIQNGTCPAEPHELSQHCRAVYFVKMANFEVDPQKLGDSVQQGIDFVQQQNHARMDSALAAA